MGDNGKGDTRRPSMISNGQLELNWQTTFPKVRCKFCHKMVSKRTAHRHDGKWVGDDCCWDDRLKATE